MYRYLCGQKSGLLVFGYYGNLTRPRLQHCEGSSEFPPLPLCISPTRTKNHNQHPPLTAGIIWKCQVTISAWIVTKDLGVIKDAHLHRRLSSRSAFRQILSMILPSILGNNQRERLDLRNITHLFDFHSSLLSSGVRIRTAGILWRRSGRRRWWRGIKRFWRRSR